MPADIDYHLHRARAERHIAYRADDELIGDVHMRLSALHLSRALLLRQVQSAPVGNVLPFRGSQSVAPREPLPVKGMAPTSAI